MILSSVTKAVHRAPSCLISCSYLVGALVHVVQPRGNCSTGDKLVKLEYVSRQSPKAKEASGLSDTEMDC